MEELNVAVDMPFGFRFPHTYRVQQLDLRAGDRLFMLTDGLLEHHGRTVDLEEMIVRTGDLHPREAARTVIAMVVAAHGGHLQDDATIMCLDRHGGRHSRRHADTGANLASASPAPTPPG
ncbi:SpoIIE family protein phosphatase [Streptomyces sp. NPDC060000]|uniref:SpoIIE family protein phosphatase n=1 Tax=Streptomyces sp. NPDC060000 TaxID=3347031 RepID=UPI0036AE4176